jgi:ABC-type transport system involved in multi-copper enzyme maturation permease subunit
MGMLSKSLVPPSPMEIIVDPAITTEVIEGGRSLDDNPFSTIRINLDIIALIGLLGSLLVLLLSYDSVNREVHEGTHRLLLSSGIPRLKIIVGKIIGGSIAAILPIATIFLLTAFWLSVSGGFGWGLNQWVSLIGIFLASVIYIIFFYALGAFLSSVVLDQVLSALSCFAVWIVLAIAIPTISPYIARAVVKVPDPAQIQREVTRMYNEERDEHLRQLLRPLLAQGLSWEDAYEKVNGAEVNAIYHRRATELNENYRRAATRQAKLSIMLACASPYSQYLLAVEDLAGLGVGRMQHLENVVRNWREKFNEYVTSKYNEARRINPAHTHGSMLDMSDAPRFKYTDPSLSYKFSHALPYILLLLGYFLIPLFLYLQAFVRKKGLLRLTFGILIACIFATSAFTQSDPASHLYQVKRAEIEVSRTKDAFERNQRLFKDGLVSERDFEEAERRYQEARLTYVYTLIRATSGSFYVSVEKAVKYQKPDGTKWVKLTLLNSLPDLGETIDQFLGLENQGGLDNYKELYSNEIRNVFLSIEKDGVIAGQPLEYKINSLSFGEKRDFDFQIMRDMDEVEVCVRYDLQTVERRKVFLTPSGSASKIVLTPENFSVESNLGARAIYRIAVERYLMGASVVKLNIPDLSPQFQWDIYDGETRISDINFRENDFKKNLTLNVHIPQRESQDVAMDKPIEFHLVATEQTQMETIEGKAKLVLIPRGIGEIEIKADNLFQESTGSKTIKLPIRVANRGSRDILDVALAIRGGAGWENSVEPIAIESLQPQREGTFNLFLSPPENVHPGEYDFRISIRGLSDGKTVYAEEKTFRIKINASANWVVIILATLLSLGLIGGAAYGAIRIMKN